MNILLIAVILFFCSGIVEWKKEGFAPSIPYFVSGILFSIWIFVIS